MKSNAFDAALQRIARELEGRVHRLERGGTARVTTRGDSVRIRFAFVGGSVLVEFGAFEASDLARRIRGAAAVAKRFRKKGGRK